MSLYRSRLNADSLPLLSFCDAFLDCILVQLRLIKLRKLLCVALALDVLKSSEIVAHRIFLLPQCIPKVFPQWDQGCPHDPIRDDLMMVSFE